jgi:DNA-binding transcriptional regulator WhiA
MKRTRENVLQMYKEYTNGSTSQELDKKYKTNVYYLFKKHNLKSRTTSESVLLNRKNKINLKYNFSNINNSEEAYIVGLFLADGYVGKHQLGLKLKKSDKEIVNKIKNYFSEEIKLQEDNNTFGFVVSSMKACENAINLGILRNKTDKEMIIPEMEVKYYSDFIRGFFDGDGTVFKCNNKYLKSNICSPKIEILIKIQEILTNNNIFSTINKESRIGKTFILPQGNSIIGTMDMYRLYIRKKEDLKRFYYFLYNDCDFLLKRKKEIFDNNFEMLTKLK